MKLKLNLEFYCFDCDYGCVLRWEMVCGEVGSGEIGEIGIVEGGDDVVCCCD